MVAEPKLQGVLEIAAAALPGVGEPEVLPLALVECNVREVLDIIGIEGGYGVKFEIAGVAGDGKTIDFNPADSFGAEAHVAVDREAAGNPAPGRFKIHLLPVGVNSEEIQEGDAGGIDLDLAEVVPVQQSPKSMFTA